MTTPPMICVPLLSTRLNSDANASTVGVRESRFRLEAGHHCLLNRLVQGGRHHAEANWVAHHALHHNSLWIVPFEGRSPFEGDNPQAVMMKRVMSDQFASAWWRPP